MANIFEFPVLNPLRVMWQGDYIPANTGTQYLYAHNPAFNTKHFDEAFAFTSLQSFEEKKRYTQPFQQSDTIRIQWLGSSGTLGNYQYARLVDQYGQIYTPKTVTVVQESGTYNGLYLYTVTIKLYDLAEGVYYLQIGYNGGSGNQYVIFEPFHCKQIHANTVRFDYYNTYNDQSVIYPASTYIMQLRVHGFITEMKPDSTFEVYEDQPMNAELVSGIPFRIFELTIGLGGKACPDWLADKFERVLLCNRLQVDSKDYTRESGSKLEPTRTKGAPLGQWAIKLRERLNVSTIDILGAPIQVGTMPQTKYFWIETMTIGSSINIRAMFKGKRNFLDFLNATYLVGQGYWAEDANYYLVFYPNATLAGTYTLTAANTLSYGVRFLLNGIMDFGADINAPSAGNFYAVVWGDGSSNVNKTALATTPAVTNIAHSYSTAKERECFVFFSDGKTFADNVMTNGACKEIGGDLPTGMNYFKPFDTAKGLLRLENNIFKYCTALATLNLSGQSLDTWAINEIIRNIYEQIGHFSSGAAVVLNSQSPSAPPSKNDQGIAMFLFRIKAAITTLTTD